MKDATFKIETRKENQFVKEKWIQKWGDYAAEALQDPSYNFFSVPNIDGIIGFKEDLGCAITFGDPICSKDNIPKLALAFHEYCKDKNLNVAYMLASEEFSRWAVNNICNVLIEVGEELVFDPHYDPLAGPRNKLRNKVNHAQHLGLTIEEYIPHDITIERELQEVGNKWLRSRRGPQIYMANIDFFQDRKNKRWFYVKDKKQILGVALLTKIEAHQGWFLKFLIVLPESPRGTSESLMIAILEALRKENCRFLTYGMIPAENLGEISGIGQCSSWIAKMAFKFAKWIFHLEKRKTYWAQFHPKIERSYILFEKPHIGIKEIRVILKSMKVDF